jgi:hypothetical protein
MESMELILNNLLSADKVQQVNIAKIDENLKHAENVLKKTMREKMINS